MKTLIGKKKKEQEERSSVQSSGRKQRSEYYSFTPGMQKDRGIGYQTERGFILMESNDPNGWLMGISRDMDTPDEDVGYSIPDIFAGEKQIRRLVDLPSSESVHHEEIIKWRAILAILLLWNTWEKDESWPKLIAKDYLKEQETGASSFQKALHRAVSGQRVEEGVRIFTLYRSNGLVSESCPLAMVSSDTIIVPAANMPAQVIESLLPSTVTWYNKKKRRFEDPTNYLNDIDRIRLIMQLRILQERNVNEKLNSILCHKGTNHLYGFLDYFIRNLNERREQLRHAMNQADSTEIRNLYHRLVGVQGLYQGQYVSGIEKHIRKIEVKTLLENDLQKMLTRSKYMVDNWVKELAGLEHAIVDYEYTYYTYDDIAFAREDPYTILEPVNDLRQDEAIEKIIREADLLKEYSTTYNQNFGKALKELAEKLDLRVGIGQNVKKAVHGWANEHLDIPVDSNHLITLEYPLEGQPATLTTLMEQYLKAEDMDIIYDVFSDRLLVLMTDEGQVPPLPETLLANWKIANWPDGKTCYAILPMSEKMVTWLMSPINRNEDDNPTCFVPASFRAERLPLESGYEIKISYAVSRQSRVGTSIVTNMVRFQKSYRFYPDDDADEVRPNSIEELSADSYPSAIVWPNEHFAEDAWRSYWVYISQKCAITPWIFNQEDWHAMPVNRRINSEKNGSWLACRTDLFPRFILLKRGGSSCGVLYNPLEEREIKAGDAVIAAIDFGTTSTTMAMKQGKRILPITLQKPEHGWLLKGKNDKPETLFDEFIPLPALTPEIGIPNLFASSLTVFSQKEKRGRMALVDGSAYCCTDPEIYIKKDMRTLYCNLKWGIEHYRQKYVKLYLQQCMLECALVACMSGASDLSWRFALPASMKPELRAEYIATLKELTTEVSELTGVPLNRETPVLMCNENEADGAFFLHDDLIDVRNGYINMDIGGNTTDISLWLKAEDTPTYAESLEFGCHAMLYESAAKDPDRFFKGFVNGTHLEEIKRLKEILAQSQKNHFLRDVSLFLFDHWLSGHAEEIREQFRSGAEPTYLSSLITFVTAALYDLCGQMVYASCTRHDVLAKLPEHMQVCFAGNGGQLVTLLPPEKEELAREFSTLAWTCHNTMSRKPARLHAVLSNHPKQEVAFGLLHSRHARDLDLMLLPKHEKNPYPIPPDEMKAEFVAFIRLFCSQFPKESALLLGDVVDLQSGTLNPESLQQLTTIVNNQFTVKDQNLLVSSANCFSGMKRTWEL